MKILASSYIPAISLYRRSPATLGSRLSTITPRNVSGGSNSSRTAAVSDDEPLRPGKNYTFELSFTNPLNDSIQVRLAVARPGPSGPPIEGQPDPLPLFAVKLPSPTFSVNECAEQWEYDIMDDKQGDEEEEEDIESSGGTTPFRKKRKERDGPGIVEKRRNTTTVILEVAVGKQTTGVIRVRKFREFPSAQTDEQILHLGPFVGKYASDLQVLEWRKRSDTIPNKEPKERWT